METLIVYDLNGHIIYTGQGNMYEPVGIPYLWIEIPQGKYVEKIDVSGETHEPIFSDYPKSEVNQLMERLELMQQALDDLIMGGAL